MTIKNKLRTRISDVVRDMPIEWYDEQVIVNPQSDPRFGDYSTNIALLLAKKLKKNPVKLAEEIADQLSMNNSDPILIEKVEVVNPGFINIWISEKYLLEYLENPPKKNGVFSGTRISVEYTDPNPFKELHIGHLYSNIIGESLSRILETNGAIVWRADYFGDVGMHVAKSIWGLKKLLKEDNLEIEELSKKPLNERIDYLGKAYAKGSNEYSENEQIKNEVEHLNKLIYIAAQRMWEKEEGLVPEVDYQKGEKIEESEISEVYNLYTLGRDWSLENFENQYERLGTKFDGYYPESKASERGYKLVKENLEKGIFVESEGAVIFQGEKHGFHTRVFINKLGLPTYEAKELGLAPWKYEDFPYDLSLIVTGNEISDYFKVLVTALKTINPELGEKTKPILHGMVNLPEGKMSSRSGNIVTVKWLLDEAGKRVMPLMSSEVENKEETSQIIGSAAVKYALLKSTIGKNTTFDFQESISFEGNSGPYIQYTFVRTQSILRKAGESSYKLQSISNKLESEERELLRLLARFDEIVEEAAVKFAPNMLCNYLFDIAQTFNHFYQKCPIIKSEENVRKFRLNLTSKSGEAIKKGLYLLGIQAPARM